MLGDVAALPVKGQETLKDEITVSLRNIPLKIP